MKTKKTYRSIHALSLTVCINVDGREIYCDFNGGFNSPRRQNGSFATSNPKIQAALERHGRFKTHFDISKVVQMESPANEVIVVTPEGIKIGVPQGSVIVEPEPVPEPEISPEPDKYISRVKNGQEAKDELNKKFGVPWSRLKNLTQTLSEASKNNVVYANWKPTR